MDEETWLSVLTAYRNGATADFLWFSPDATGEDWEPLWTMPACSVAAAERGARQIARTRARRVRHARRAQIQQAHHNVCTVVIVSVLPDRVQMVRVLASGEQFNALWLEDDVLALLLSALI